MRKTILTLTLAALLLTSCAEVPENIKNDSSNISVQNRNSDDVDLSAYKHIYETENTLLFPHIPETVYRFDVKWSSESYADKYDEIGKAFVSNYDASRWESSTDPMDNAVYKNYIFEDSAASLGCSSNESFFYISDSSLEVSFDLPDRIQVSPEDMERKFVLSDGSEITLSKAAEVADSYMNKLNSAVGKETSGFNSISYSSAGRILVFDYLPKVYGLQLSTIGLQIDLNSISGKLLSNSLAFSKRKAMIYSGSEECAIESFLSTAIPSNEARCDEVLTLNEALELFDKSAAPNVRYELLSAELKYIVTCDEIKPNVPIKQYAVPIWELILYNMTQEQRYICAIEAQTGEISLARIKKQQ